MSSFTTVTAVKIKSHSLRAAPSTYRRPGLYPTVDTNKWLSHVSL